MSTSANKSAAPKKKKKSVFKILIGPKPFRTLKMNIFDLKLALWPPENTCSSSGSSVLLSQAHIPDFI